MSYKVTKQYERGGESACGEFNTLNDARGFIRDKLIEDASMRIRITYRIYESFEVIEEYDPCKGEIPGAGAAPTEQPEVKSTGGKGSGASFSPTPLNSAPRPPGIPHNWVKDDDDTGDEK